MYGLCISQIFKTLIVLNWATHWLLLVVTIYSIVSISGTRISFGSNKVLIVSGRFGRSVIAISLRTLTLSTLPGNVEM